MAAVVIGSGSAGGATSLGGLLGHWHLEPSLAAGLALAALAYALGLRAAARWPAARTAAFAAGLGAVALALGSGIDARAEELLSVHMVQHLLLCFVAAPLLVAGAPLTLALRALPGRPRRALAGLMHRGPLRVLGHPALAWTILPAAMVGTHFTPLYGYALAHPWAHELEHALYLGAGLLFWTPVIGAEPLPWRLPGGGRVIYLLAAMPPMAVIGGLIGSGSRVRYPAYLAPGHALGVSALADQSAAGAVMTVGGTVSVGLVTMAVAWAAWQREERRTRAREAYEDLRAGAVEAGGLAP